MTDKTRISKAREAKGRLVTTFPGKTTVCSQSHLPKEKHIFPRKKEKWEKKNYGLISKQRCSNRPSDLGCPKSEEILWDVSFYNQSSIKYLFPFLVLNHSCFSTQLLWKILPHCQIQHWVVNYIFLLHISSIRFHFHRVILAKQNQKLWIHGEFSLARLCKSFIWTEENNLETVLSYLLLFN